MSSGEGLPAGNTARSQVSSCERFIAYVRKFPRNRVVKNVVAFGARFRENGLIWKEFGLLCCFVEGGFIVSVFVSLPDTRIIDTRYVARPEKTQSNVSSLGTNLL